MNRVEKLLARFCIIIVSLIVAIAVVEYAANYYLWNIASEDDFRYLASINQIKERYGDDFFLQKLDKRKLSWSPHQYLGYYPSPSYVFGENKHNTLGFRGDEVAVAIPEHTYRIVAVGGSTTYTIDVKNYRNSYPDLLEDQLRASGYGNAEVINAGIAGHSSYHNLINIEFRILPLKPDLIVIYQGFNDIEARFVYPYSRYLGDNSGAEAPFVSDTVMPDIAEYSTALRILGIRTGYTRSHAALDWHYGKLAASNHKLTFERQFSGGTYPSGIFEDVSAMEMLENNPPIHFERNLLSMLAIADRHDIDVLLITMVTSRDFHGRTGSAKNRFYSSNEYTFAMAEHNDVTRGIAASTGTPIFDMAEIFPDDPTLFTDGLHMTAEGNHVRAQLIGDFIMREFLS